MQEISRDIPKKEDQKFNITPTDMFKRYSNMVWRLALTRVSSTTRADDVLQEVFLRVVKLKPEFKDETHLRAWLIKVTLNCSKKIMNSAWMRHYAGLEDNFVAVYEGVNEVYLAVQSLKPKYKTVVHLHYYEGLKVDEIANALEISPSAVKQRLKRAREQLKDYMTGDEYIV